MKYDAEDRFFPCLPEKMGSLAAPFDHIPRCSLGRIALIGCFRPRQCGIATYTADIHDHLRRERPEIAVDVYAMRAEPAHPADPGIAASIEAVDAASYRAAAERINRSGADIVWLQHEFGIFGGEAGDMILDLIDRLAAPLVVTLHTVLAEPSDAQRRVMEHIARRASKLLVMSDFGRRTLIVHYGVAPENIALIEHGTPVRPFIGETALRGKLGLTGRPVLSTFGLLGPGKGLETAIRALPAIVERHPDVLYRIVGATHPNLIAAEGETYRHSLEALAASLGVADNIAWDNRFLETEELLDQIQLCDIYLAPYPNLAQVTSGTLAYAVALGRAVVSTPFVHARELLADEVGLLVSQGDSGAISDAVLALLASPGDRQALQQRAYARGRRTAWPRIARESAALLETLVADRTPRLPPRSEAPSPRGVWAMCDDVGILQHGCGIVPDRNHGYCIDDNARALMLAHRLGGAEPKAQTLRFASFVQHAWNPDVGAFRNFMGYDRRWLEECGSDDSNGRAIWALGDCAARAESDALAAWGHEWFGRTAPLVGTVASPRALAFVTLGAAALLDRFPEDVTATALLEHGGAFLARLRHAGRSEAWDWFEPVLAYDNARLPEALLRAGDRAGREDWIAAGLATLEWLCVRQTGAGGQFRPVGSEGFGRKQELLPFDQQPLEAWATIDACCAAFALTGDAIWQTHAEAAWGWFFGRNDRGTPLASMRTGRCCDGLTPRGVNTNVGAESTLAFHLAYHSMNTLFWPRGEREEADAAHADLQT